MLSLRITHVFTCIPVSVIYTIALVQTFYLLVSWPFPFYNDISQNLSIFTQTLKGTQAINHFQYKTIFEYLSMWTNYIKCQSNWWEAYLIIGILACWCLGLAILCYNHWCNSQCCTLFDELQNIDLNILYHGNKLGHWTTVIEMPYANI